MQPLCYADPPGWSEFALGSEFISKADESDILTQIALDNKMVTEIVVVGPPP